ncbi:hypothetical protein [Caballeronia sp. AZ7_KS35]|uniref:hypothetical protein n=1 Tax=Caballeronia sp. AZ7_KS35 TaxID=2921762 RepID=UPI002027E6E1|nr:hypothetical protein [Caballeronia sp. AZ7_KS35]
MFSNVYKGVAYFGLWAEESAESWGKADALALLRDAVLCCPNEDMRTAEVLAALDYLGNGATRPAPFAAFRKALDVPDPADRYRQAREAYHAIGKVLGAAVGH